MTVPPPSGPGPQGAWNPPPAGAWPPPAGVGGGYPETAYAAGPGGYPPPGGYPEPVYGPAGYPPPGGYPDPAYGAGYGGYPPPVYPGPGYPPPKPGTNGFAIAALIFGIVGGVLLGFVFGFIALSQTKRTGQNGRGLALVGIILSAMWTILIVVLVIVAATTGAPGT